MPSLPRHVERGLTRRAALVGAGSAVTAPALTTRAIADVDGMVEPRMRLARRSVGAPTVAITLDACPGRFDLRVAQTLVDARVPATIFICGPWMRRNPDALAFLLAHRDIFSLQNHGARHCTCQLGGRRIWGLPSAGDLAGVRAEVEDGARLVAEATGRPPTWFRGAAALYSPPALGLIRSLGFGIAAFSVNGDLGASLSAAATAANISAARDGDVVISHINQPTRPSGAGVADGVLALKRRGVRFLRLDALSPADVTYSWG